MQKSKRDVGMYVLSIFLLLGSIHFAVAGDAPSSPSFFSSFPNDTSVVIRLSSLNQAINHVNSFMLPAMGMPLGSELESFFQEMTHVETIDFMDKDKPIWFVACFDEEMDESLSLVVPISDQEKLIPHLESKEDNIYTIKNLNVVLKNHVALFHKGKPFDSTRDWFEKTSWETLAKSQYNAEDDLVIWINIDTLIPKLQKPLGEFQSMMTGMTSTNPVIPQNTVQLLQKEIGWFIDLAEQIQELRISLRFSPENVTLQKYLQLKENTPFSQFVQQAKFGDVRPVLPIVQKKSFVTMVSNVDTSSFDLVKERLLKDFADLQVDIEPMKASWDMMAKAYTGPMGMTFDVTGNLENPVHFIQLIALKDEKNMQEIMNQFSKIMQSTSGMILPVTGIQIDVKEEKDVGTYKEVPYSKISIRYKGGDPESPVVQQLSKQKLDYYYAITNNLMIMTTDDITSVIDMIVNSSKDENPARKEFLSEQSFLRMKMDLLQGLKAIKQQMAKQTKGVNPLLMVEIPPDAANPGIWIDMMKQKGNILSKVTIPAKEISTIRDAFMGGMMKQQMQNQGQQ